jgi:hypothetical protein
VSRHAAPDDDVPRIEELSPEEREALDELRREAQAIFDTHILMGGTDVCAVCGTVGPCPARVDATRITFGYGVLPARRPGASLPEEETAETWNGFAVRERANRVA